MMMQLCMDFDLIIFENLMYQTLKGVTKILEDKMKANHAYYLALFKHLDIIYKIFKFIC